MRPPWLNASYRTDEASAACVALDLVGVALEPVGVQPVLLSPGSALGSERAA